MRVIVLAPLLVVLLSHSATPEQATQTAPTYRSLVDGYRRIGTTEIEQTLNAPRDATEAAVDAALSPASGWTWEDLRGAAMLHTDVALRALASRDGAATEFHLTAARRLLERTESLSPPQKDFVWRWYMARASQDQIPRRFGHRETARQRTPKSDGGSRPPTGPPPTFATSRPEHSISAVSNSSGRARTKFASPASWQPSPLQSNQLQGTWLTAATALVEALKQDPSLHAAALHLGRIRMLQGQRLEAATLFRSALASVDPSVAYLAALFLGSLEEREERFGEAEALYRDAVRRVPYGQAAPLALAQLLSRTGREAEAREVLAARLQPRTCRCRADVGLRTSG